MDLKINGAALIGFENKKGDQDYLRSLGYSDAEITAAFEEAQACQESQSAQASV